MCQLNDQNYKHFIVTLPSARSEMLLREALKELACKSLLSVPVDHIHFTIVYLFFPICRSEKLSHHFHTMFEDLDEFSVSIKSLKPWGDFLMWEFDKSDYLRELRQNLLRNLSPENIRENHSESEWRPHMVASKLPDGFEFGSNQQRIVESVSEAIRAIPIVFDRIRFTRLYQGRFETLLDWNL